MGFAHQLHGTQLWDALKIADHYFPVLSNVETLSMIPLQLN